MTTETEILSIRIDSDTKTAFTQICEEVGLSPSQAIKLFARAVINYRGIPFEIKAPQPNAETIAAMNELIQGKGQKSESIHTLLLELTEGKVNHVLP
jgi:DNA-damage-inducible protein J